MFYDVLKAIVKFELGVIAELNIAGNEKARQVDVLLAMPVGWHSKRYD